MTVRLSKGKHRESLINTYRDRIVRLFPLLWFVKDVYRYVYNGGFNKIGGRTYFSTGVSLRNLTFPNCLSFACTHFRSSIKYFSYWSFKWQEEIREGLRKVRVTSRINKESSRWNCCKELPIRDLRKWIPLLGEPALVWINGSSFAKCAWV